MNTTILQTTMDRRILASQGKAWAMYHGQIVDQLMKKNMNRVDLSVKMLNDYFFDAAQRVISAQLKAGVIDSMFKPVRV